ncbi:MAG: ATP-binding cassette domain-containing protein [Chloroflexi bacterium]|nr:ATP-binding cassette domain-containing protein [Chloroflexota bacterium]
MSISLSNVTKRFGREPVVKGLSLEIEQGELFVLLGSSGSGKSTLLRMIAGLTSLDEGRILLDQRDVTNLPTQQRGVGFVFQNYSLFKHMTVRQNIAFGLEIRGMARALRNQRVQELLDLIGLSELGDRIPAQLSGGQQQRVALARALAPEPEVLLLDEPFGALDVKIRSQLRQNLREIQQRLGITAILVTHDQDEAFELADRIGIIEKGELLEIGKPEDLYRRPQNHFTATFLGTANLLRARRNGTVVHVGDQHLPAPEGTEHLSGQMIDLLLRPESIDLALNKEELDGGALGEGQIESITFAGALERVTVRMVDLDEPIEIVIAPERARRLGIRPGDRVWLGVTDYHLLPIEQVVTQPAPQPALA